MLKSRLPHIARHPCSYRYLRCRPENKGELRTLAPQQEGWPAQGTCGRTPGGRDSSDFGSREAPSSTVQAFPVRVGPANPDREQNYQYWPFSTSDLYNWKAQNPSFSEKPQGLTIFQTLSCLLSILLGMIVSSCYRCFSPRRNGSEFCRKHGNMFLEWMGDRPCSPT